MKLLVLQLLFLASFAAYGSAQAVICSVTATSIPLSTLYASGRTARCHLYSYSSVSQCQSAAKR